MLLLLFLVFCGAVLGIRAYEDGCLIFASLGGVSALFRVARDALLTVLYPFLLLPGQLPIIVNMNGAKKQSQCRGVCGSAKKACVFKIFQISIANQSNPTSISWFHLLRSPHNAAQTITLVCGARLFDFFLRIFYVQ